MDLEEKLEKSSINARKKEFLKHDSVKLEIIKYLSDQKWHSYYDVQSSLGMNYNSLKKHLSFMEMLNLVRLIVIPAEESGTGKGSYKVKITTKGVQAIS